MRSRTSKSPDEPRTSCEGVAFVVPIIGGRRNALGLGRALRGVAVLALAAGTLACGDEPEKASEDPAAESTTSAPPTTEAKPSDLKDLAVKPIIEKPSGEAPKELVKEDIVVGTGAESKANSLVVVDYVGNSWSTGVEFDSSWDRGQPFDLTLGTGSVIKGWDEGLVGMKVGGRRKLTIPADLAYGEQSPSEDIKPNETLVFVVDLRYSGEKPKVDLAGVADDGKLQSTDLTVGTGDLVTATSTVRAQMVAFLLSSGKEFYSTWESQAGAETLVLGGGSLIKGVDEGLVGMKVGGRRMLVVPASMGYGDKGAGDGAIPPNAALVYVVDVIGITPS